jgi:DNA-binding response OmpR family regulator
MRNVLIVEDESSIRSFVVINLKRAGYNIYEAESGEEALNILAANPYIKLALLDLMLPGMDGFELCRQIRALNPGMGIIMDRADARGRQGNGTYDGRGRLCDKAVFTHGADRAR